MLDQQQLLASLGQLMQKTRGVDAQVSVLPGLPAAPPPVQYTPPPQAQAATGDAPKTGSAGLGFLGGLGDTTNAQTGVVDPSLMTQLNQYIMKAQNGAQPLPWQQTGAQNTGQALSKLLGI